MNKKRIALVVGLLIVLLVIFFFQKKIIDDFSLKSERIELFFDMDNEILPFILSEEEYIGERYKYALYIEKEVVLNEKPLTIIAVDKNYYELEPIEFIYGENTFLKETQIIISDKLAKEKYGNVNPIGKSIGIEGKIYEIVNIYKTNKNHIFLKGRNDIAYIDYEYAKNNLNNYISIISIQKPMGSKEEFFKEKFIDYLRFRNPGLNEEILDITDYSDANRVLIEWHRGTKLFIASLLFILIGMIFLRKIKVIDDLVKKDLKSYYLKEIILLRINEILEETIKLVLLLFGGIFLLQWIINFQFNIPGKYLPTNDIFDFQFYQLLNNSNKKNLSSYGHLYNITLEQVKLLTLGFLILALITFLLIMRMINNKILGGKDKYGESSI